MGGREPGWYAACLPMPGMPVCSRFMVPAVLSSAPIDVSLGCSCQVSEISELLDPFDVMPPQTHQPDFPRGPMSRPLLFWEPRTVPDLTVYYLYVHHRSSKQRLGPVWGIRSHSTNTLSGGPVHRLRNAYCRVEKETEDYGAAPHRQLLPERQERSRGPTSPAA